MPLYKIASERLEQIKATTFADEKLLERKDLQRLLKSDISVLGDDLMVIAEEFGDWEESRRRIDLLCLDKQARLVVIEIKRTEDGEHMELQAIRYAAMVSSMTLDQAIATYARALSREDASIVAQKEILEFLEIDSVEEAELADEVRIILVSADFSTELTTAVLWLNRHGIDLTCIRLKPYKHGSDVLIDVTQTIPLPEAADYEIKVRNREIEVKKVQGVRQELLRRFWSQYIDRSKNKTSLYANISTTSDHWLSAAIGRSGFSLTVSVTEDRARIECYIRLGKANDQRNQTAFKALLAQKAAIESNFGGELDWQELSTRIGSRICKDIAGGWKTPEADWPQLQDQILDTMIRLEAALKKPVQDLKL